MNSSYLKNTRSMEELDALLEKKGMKVSNIGSNLIDKDVPEAIGNINKICEESIAMIEEKSKQVIDKLSSWVKSTTAEFLNETEVARDKISKIVTDPADQNGKDRVSAMISETSYLSVKRIKACADSSVEKIRTEVELSLQNLKEDLTQYNKRIEQIPLVIQYSKIDLVEKGIQLLATEALEKDLNRIPKTPSFEASAWQGINFIATLKRIIVTTVASIKQESDSAKFRQDCCHKPGAAEI